jgi:hypothetical protein
VVDDSSYIMLGCDYDYIRLLNSLSQPPALRLAFQGKPGFECPINNNTVVDDDVPHEGAQMAACLVESLKCSTSLMMPEFDESR